MAQERRPRSPGSGGRGRGPAPDKPAAKKWGGVARRGARNLDEPPPGTAAAAWRDAAAKADRDRERNRTPRPADDRDEWIDAGPVRDEASAAVRRGSAPQKRRPPRKRAGVPDEVAQEVGRAAGPAWAGRVKDRLGEAAKAYEAERFRDARRTPERLVRAAPDFADAADRLGSLGGSS